jgi:Sulfotransferase family
MTLRMDRTLAGLDQPQGISQVPEPDFICIGMQKAGTGWLFDQLQFHPDFWMPPVKQLHYLEHERTKTGTAEKFLRIARRNPVRRKMRLSHRREWDERDVAFLEQYVSYDGEPMDIEKYIALFRYKGNCLSGEINSGYSGLGEETISALAQRLPDLRVFIILRDPVARGWSQVSMAYRNENFDIHLLDNPQRFGVWLKTFPAINKVAYPSRIVERWLRAAPKLEFKHFFFDLVADEPEEARRQILLFLGADPEKPSADLSANHNRKSSDKKLELSNGIQMALIEHFAEELRACSRIFGGPAEAWATRYGI